ncbi:hypothetical protein [Cohnella caldifontis]|uniref:hypothetical protein n=1 Tax=Cohnella caldifontis TaxID=3027471 RepID=UPI0023EB3AC1|nr:hypothetical protein [Cohnella sp. YIM B05605]
MALVIRAEGAKWPANAVTVPSEAAIARCAANPGGTAEATAFRPRTSFIGVRVGRLFYFITSIATLKGG